MRRARPSLQYCWMWQRLDLDVETGDDPVGDHARPEAPRGGSGDLPVEEELHPAGAAEVELVPKHLLEELPAAVRAVEDLSPAHLQLEEGEAVGEPGGPIPGGQGEREPEDPPVEDGLDVSGAQGVTDGLEVCRPGTRLEAIGQRREADPAPHELALGPLMAVQAELHRVRGRSRRP